jgi:competence protein ComEC
MISRTCAFLAGVLTLQYLPELPPWYCYASVFAALLALRWRPAWLPAIFLLGFFWAAYQAQATLDDVLDARLEGRTVLVQGTVADLPGKRSNRSLRFLFHADRLDAGDGWKKFTRKLRLSWYQTREIPALGDRWQLAVRLKRPHGNANPGGFDYERWLFQQRISATGYVRDDKRNCRLEGQSWLFTDGMRKTIAAWFNTREHAPPGLALIRALTIGDAGAIDPAQWDALRATGTTHLMVISGTHISLVAGLVFWLTRLFWSRLGGWPESVPSVRVAVVTALLSAIFYAFLTGMGIPSRRALIMLAVGMTALLAGRWSRPVHVLCLAVIATLMIDPLAVLATGWWLSFWAVSVIFYITSGRLGHNSLWHKLTCVHIVLAVAMLPLLLVFYQQASLIAPLANVIAVPWVSLLVVPTALLGTLLLFISTTAAGMLLNLSAGLMDTLWPCLAWLASLDFALLNQHQPLTWTLPPAIAGLFLLFAPRGFPGKWLGLMLLLPMLAAGPPGPAFGEAWVTLLDVGQGLSTVIRTHDHTLVYDAGPSYSPGFDTGRTVVVPYLRSQGVGRIDKLFVSHGDNDHIGGVPSLLKGYPVADVEAGIPERLKMRKALQCHRGEHWRWDGVDFSVLHPDARSYRKGNNSSCVIRIEVQGGRRVLLTGDIEAESERILLQESRDRLPVDVLVVPHHGSLTSSLPAFVETVRPDYALFPTGYRNRFRFPREPVLDRYRKAGSVLLDTAPLGAITIRLRSGGLPPEAESFRCSHRHYWRALSCDTGSGYGCCDK